MPIDLEGVTFDELEDETNDEPQQENDEPTTTKNEDNNNEEVSDETPEEAGETVDDIDTDELETAFNESSNEEDDVEEGDKEENTDEEGDQTEEEGEEEEEVDDTRFVDDLASQFGLDPEEDFDKELDDTWDDALEVTKKAADKKAQQNINTFFEQYPDVGQYATYRANGGDPDTFREEVLNAPSYEDMEIEGNEARQEEIVREKLREVEGFDDEKIQSKVDTYKSSGVLKEEAEDAKDILSNKQEERRQELVRKQEKKAEQRKEEIQQKQQEFKETIHNSNQLGAFQLPEDQKDTFENYLFEPVNDEGMTQAEVDYQNMDQEEILQMYYMSFIGLDNLDDMIDNQASTKRAEQLSDKLKKSSSRNVSDKSERGSQSRKKSNDPDLSNFDLDSAIS